MLKAYECIAQPSIIMTAHCVRLSMMQAVQIDAFLGARIRSTKALPLDLTINMRRRHYNDKRHAEGVGTNTGYMQCNYL